MTIEKISRRTLGGLAAAGVGAPLLVACGGDDPEAATDAGGTPSSTPTSASPTASSPSPADATSGAAPAGDVLTTTADIEVGGGAVFPDEEVVVTQPTEGEFRCFSAVCTHQGCLVAGVSDGAIVCDCHGSSFSIEDGEVLSGPASSPLGEEKITVSGDQISLG